MSNVATRLLSLILMLQSRAKWKAGDLADELGVSERTVHRYMEMLDDMGIPIYSERGPYGGFSLLRGYKLPPLIFTAEEATVLYMGAHLVHQIWGSTYNDAVTGATAKLDNVLPDDLRQSVNESRQHLLVFGLTARDYRPWDEMLHTLRQCVEEHRVARLSYLAFSQEQTCRDVEPYALLFRRGLWYLVGYCRLREAMRTFRVDRTEKVEALPDRFTPDEEFAPRDYFEKTMQFERDYTATIRLDAVVAPIIREHYGHWMDLTENGDGSVTVKFEAGDLNWAAGWALSYGSAAHVIGPPELVERVRAEAAAVLDRYA